MLLRIVSIIFPLFAIVLAGWLYGRRHKPDMALANQLNMDVFVPALVFAAPAGKSFDLIAYQALAIGGAALALLGEAALPAAVALFLVENLLHFPLCAWMLDHHARLATLWRMPMMLAALAGIALWPPLVTAFRVLGDISIPLLLFTLGVRLADASFHAWGVGTAGALPPAVLNYVFAERYAQGPDKVASIVMVGNVAALLFIPITLALALNEQLD
ncbi:MAG: AEC family transporter [Zoogloeaceae bacterium]|nr:AEC family transporter [Zoogloeaceae bacterium]MCK6383624.1 AEC family transporter [Rhodocyclaceae bacterium]